MSDDSLKSAYDLAMDRLRAKDREEGVRESKPLTAQQKKTIADLRARAKAKLAEVEILNGKDRGATMGDPEKPAVPPVQGVAVPSPIEHDEPSQPSRVEQAGAKELEPTADPPAAEPGDAALEIPCGIAVIGFLGRARGGHHRNASMWRRPSRSAASQQYSCRRRRPSRLARLCLGDSLRCSTQDGPLGSCASRVDRPARGPQMASSPDSAIPGFIVGLAERCGLRKLRRVARSESTPRKRFAGRVE